MELFNSDQLVSTIAAATEEVFSTMLGLPVSRHGAYRLETGHDEPFDGVIALIGLAGPCAGASQLSCSAELACKLSGALLASTYTAVNEDVLDAMGELANMIVGNVKSVLEEDLGPMGLSIPTVVYGHNYQTRSSSVKEWIATQFECGGGCLEIKFALMPGATDLSRRSLALQETA